MAAEAAAGESIAGRRRGAGWSGSCGGLALLLGIACSAAEPPAPPFPEVPFPYVENFDAWPDGGCPVGSPAHPCGHSWLHNGDVRNVAGGFPCDDGKCARGIYDENESATYLFARVVKANGTAPAPDSAYWRASWYYDPGFDFPGNSLKRARFYATHGAPALEVGWIIAEAGTVFAIDIYDHEHFGARVCRVEDTEFDWQAPANRGRWVEVESAVQLNEPGRADGWCKIWIDGRLRVHETGFDFRDSYEDALANGWIGGNYSGEPGDRFPNIWYMDNVCIAADETARHGACADPKATRP